MYINQEDIDRAINDISQAIKAFAKSVLEIADKMFDSLWKIAAKFPDNDAETLKKAVFNRPQYNHIKPNTKPYSAFKRLYRVQGK